MRLTTAIENYLDKLGNLGRSPATITAYGKDLEQLATQISTNPLIHEVSRSHLEDFINSLQEKKFSNKTISRKLNSIKSLFKYLSEAGLVETDPSKEIPHPELTQKLPRVLSPVEYNTLRALAENNVRLHSMIELMLQTGLRIGEVSRLKLDHLQFKPKPAQILIVEHASNPMRLVELNNRALTVMDNYISKRQASPEDQGFVFNTKNGGNMIIRNIRSAINRVLKKAELNDATVNDLRNTFIVHQLNSGVSLAKIAQTVGHRRFSSTEKYLPLMKRKKPGNGERIVVL